MQDEAGDPFGDAVPFGAGPLQRAVRWAGGVLSLVILGGAAWWTYELGQRDATAVPVIRALEGPAKVQPEDPGGTVAEHQGLSVTSVISGTPPQRKPAAELAPAPAAPAEEDVAQGALPPVVPEPPAQPVPPVAEAPRAADPAPPLAAPAAPAAPPDAVATLTPAPRAVEPPRPAGTLPEDRPAADRESAPVSAAPAGPAAVPTDGSITPGEALPPVPTPQSPVLALPAGPDPGTARERDLAPEVAGPPLPQALPPSARAPVQAERPGRRPAAIAAPSISAAAAPVPAPAPAAARETAPAAPPPRAVPPEAAALPPKGTQLIQLGAFESPEVARAEWTKLLAQHGDLLGRKGPIVQRTDSSGRIFYRLRAEGFENRAEASATCAALTARGAACIPARQD